MKTKLARIHCVCAAALTLLVVGNHSASATDWLADVLNVAAGTSGDAQGAPSTDTTPQVSTDIAADAATESPVLMDNLATGPTTAPNANVQSYIETYAERSLSEFIGHFSAYEPMYFIAGATDPLAKFQLSFKYRLFNKESPLAKKIPLIYGLHFSYTQLSVWQLDKPSAPFYDSNYQPSFFYSDEDIRIIKIPTVSQLGLQGGYWHDSNGQAGKISRSANMVFIRPIFVFGDPEHFHFDLFPSIYTYIDDLSDNPDLPKYRGYCDMRAKVGWRQGLELAFMGRWGSDYNRGCAQLDLTYPFRDLLDRNLDLYLDAQYFIGYGESLLSYNRRTQAFRIGVALVR